MYIQEIYIEIKSDAEYTGLINEFGRLMVYYYHNGQIQGVLQSSCIKKGRMFGLQSTLESISLDYKYENSYVKNQRKKIEYLCDSILQFRIIAKPFSNEEIVCDCEKNEFYILITNLLSIASPLTCGNCNGNVPLYKLPEYGVNAYLPILSWQSDYISCDTLQIGCKVGERWALNQMENINSQLSRQGRTICRKIEQLTQVPTYYYLHNWTKYKGSSFSRPCPGCNQHWNFKESDDPYEFRCEHCRLVSTTSPNA